MSTSVTNCRAWPLNGECLAIATPNCCAAASAPIGVQWESVRRNTWPRSLACCSVFSKSGAKIPAWRAWAWNS
ncbi:hypothetical protein D3C86_1780650 [compost metagenome]